MKSRLGFAVGALALIAMVPQAGATPSSTFWTPATPYVQPFGVLHVTYDTYFGSEATYPVDFGLTMGVINSQKVQMELGFDFLYPTYSAGEPMDFPILLNGKIGSPEGALFKDAPGWSAGFYAVGFEKDVTDYNAFHGEIGKTFPKVGSLTVGGYYGMNENLFRSVAGDDQRGGFMAAWTSPSIDVARIDHINFAWDVQTGENVVGATGGGICLYLTPAVSILTGPTFFFDEGLQPGGAGMMWSIQLDADVSFLGD